jgi:hypothetical protein
MSPPRRRSVAGPNAIELIEESVHLLRAVPAGTLALYYAGTAPFVLGLLFFWAYMTWFAPPPVVNAWAACGLVVLFAAMKAVHADFCSRLMAQRMGAAAAAWSWARMGRLAAGQMRVQAWGLILLPLAMAAIVPFGWVYAYFQNESVLGEAEDTHQLAIDQAALWPGQNHLGILFISVLGAAAWINLAAAFWLVPWLANHLLGIENIFGFSGWWGFNTTFLASVTGMAWMVADPLVKAFYTLRCFYGRARVTGEDLRVRLPGRGAPGTLGRAAAALLLLAALAAVSPGARAAEAQRPAAAVNAGDLDASIDEVLAGRDFRWRMRPPARAPDAETDGPLKRFARQGVEAIRNLGRAIRRLWNRIVDWLERLFPGGGEQQESGGPALGGTVLRAVLYVFAAAAAVLVCVVIGLVLNAQRRSRPPAVEAAGMAPVSPDLADESSHAGLLAPEGWIELARRQLERGEWRLALRALYLATLARLAADGLVSLAKFKTNMDYEREAARRSLGRREIVAWFSSRRLTFEAVWYGRTEASESQARKWLLELEGPRPP